MRMKQVMQIVVFSLPTKKWCNKNKVVKLSHLCLDIAVMAKDRKH